MVNKKDSWNSHLGVILAVSGSAVGLGNFLRFPGQAAQNGGGAFMLAYFISFLIIGLPICWAEWTMGRYGGQRGFNSCPGILNAVWSHPAAKYLGVIGVIIPIIIYMYYVYMTPSFSPTFVKEDRAISRCSFSMAADIWTRIRACPFGTTGK